MITARLQRFIGERYPDPERAMEKLAGLELPGDRAPSERILAAAALAAQGDPGRLDAMLELAEVDWRDLLVTAGLEHDDWPEILDRRLGVE